LPFSLFFREKQAYRLLAIVEPPGAVSRWFTGAKTCEEKYHDEE
jgi:hypothetical protein